jgi:hypothetical protein
MKEAGGLSAPPPSSCPAGCAALSAAVAAATGLPSCVCLASAAGRLRGTAQQMRAALIPAVAGEALSLVGATWLLARCAAALAVARRELRARRARKAAGLPVAEDGYGSDGRVRR